MPPESVSKLMQNSFFSRRFLHVFCTHSQKKNSSQKRNFLHIFFQTCLHKVSQNACKRHSIQEDLCPCFARIYQVKIPYKKPVSSTFLKLVSTNCLKTHAKWINFKTVFDRVLHENTKVKIAHKNAYCSTFYFFKCLYKLSRTHLPN